MGKIGDYIWWFLFSGKINCNCNKSRLDGYHNINCVSWLNARPDKRFIFGEDRKDD